MTSPTQKDATEIDRAPKVERIFEAVDEQFISNRLHASGYLAQREETPNRSRRPSQDSTRTYLREMGSVPLLTRDEEQSLAQQMDHGRDLVRRAVLNSRFVSNQIAEVLRQIKESQMQVADVFEHDSEMSTATQEPCASGADRVSTPGEDGVGATPWNNSGDLLVVTAVAKCASVPMAPSGQVLGRAILSRRQRAYEVRGRGKRKPPLLSPRAMFALKASGGIITGIELRHNPSNSEPRPRSQQQCPQFSAIF